MSPSVRHHLLLVAIAALVMFTNLGKVRLWDRDEPRNAGCAAEMIERGDWVTPVFNDELRTHKPVLLYWFMMSAYAVFGVNEFSARFWSAALAIGTTLATYHIGRRLFDPQAGLWAGMAICTSLMFGLAGRAATPDSVLIFFATMAMLVYVLGTFPNQAGLWMPRSWLVVMAMYAFMGIAILAKGPVGLVLPTAVIGMFLLIVRLPASSDAREPTWSSRLVDLVRPFAPLHFLQTCWAMRPLTAIAVAAVVALPWYLWVGARTDGQWLSGFFLEHNVGRAMQPMEGHRGSILFYPLALLIGFFPWSVLMAPMLADAVCRIRQRDRWSEGTILALCWIGVYVALFSIARTKLPSYVTPCYPGLALLAGSFLSRVARSESLAFPGWTRLSFGALTVVGLVITIALPLAAHRFLPGEEWLGAIGLIPLVGGLAGVIAGERHRLDRTIPWLAATSVALIVIVFGYVTVRIDSHQQAHRLLQTVQQRSAHAELASLHVMEPSWVFYAGQTIWSAALNDETIRWEEAKGALPPHKVWNPKPSVDLVDFLGSQPDRYVITTRSQYERWQLDRLAELQHIEVISDVPYFLKKERLLLLGWNEQSAALARRQPTGSDSTRR